MDSPPHRPRQDTSPPFLPAEDLSGVFEAPMGFGENLVGAIVAGRFTVTQLIGSGGMGCVYQAFDAADQRDVALKVLKNDRIDSGGNVQRFMQEAQVLSMLSHPNVVQLIDFGQDENGVFYLAMELLQGTDLADYLTERRRLEWE
ncbi:MAG: protein kinase, partial [Myxococcales bacterium]|nr:protein kinase [Myxococcales bacterium]